MTRGIPTDVDALCFGSHDSSNNTAIIELSTQVVVGAGFPIRSNPNFEPRLALLTAQTQRELPSAFVLRCSIRDLYNFAHTSNSAGLLDRNRTTAADIDKMHTLAGASRLTLG